MEWLLPSLTKAGLLQTIPNLSTSISSSSSTFGSSASASSAADLPPPLLMEPENDEELRANESNNKIITLEDDSDDDDDGPPMLDRVVPAAAPPLAAPTPKRSSSIINVPVSKEQFSIIEAHKDDRPKTLLEALQKFNESRKQLSSSSATTAAYPTTPLSALPSSSSFVNSNPSAAAALAKLLPSLLKKPVTPLAALPKKTATTPVASNSASTNSATKNPAAIMPVFNFKKPVVLRPKTSSAATGATATATIIATPNLSLADLSMPALLAPNSSTSSSTSTPATMPSLVAATSTTSTPLFTPTTATSSNPSFSISIKETMNPLLESFLAKAASSSKKASTFSDSCGSSDDKPPTLTDFSDDVTMAAVDADDEKCKESKTNPIAESEELPPSLDIFNNNTAGNESEEEDEAPPKLECEIKEKMAVTRSQNFSCSDPSLRNVTTTTTKSIRKQPPRKRCGNAGKSENSPMITKFDETDFDAPPPLDLYVDKQSEFRASSTSSGISSIGEFHSPPSCSPLAPINGNFSRSKPVKETPPPATTTIKTATTTKSTATKRKSKTPPAPEKPKKRPRRSAAATKKTSEPIANLELQNWIPIGKPWAEMVSIGSSPSKKAVCCFPAIKHKTENITFNILDVISVAAGEEEDGDNIGKIDRIFFDKKLGMCANVLWYYKYSQCILKDENREEIHQHYNFDSRELIASKHLDTISCDSIQSHAFVLTFTEYCRYVAETKYDVLPPSLQSRCKELWPRGEDNYPRRRYLPHEDTPQDLVFFCRKYYSVNRKAISSGLPLPKATRRRSRRHRKQRSITHLLPVAEDSDDSENRSHSP